MIRLYKDNDYSYVLELLKEFNNKIDLISNPFYKCLVYDDGIIKGCLVFEEIYDRVELDYIVVDNNCRRLGIASKLMGYLVNYAKNNSVSNITLEVNENNTSALNLYKKYKFEMVSRRENYYKDNDAILMIRKFDNNE